MISPKNRRTLTYTLLGLVMILLFFCSVIYPPFHGYYTTDENFVADSGVLLWYGNTPRGLDWPAAPHMLFFYVSFGLSCLGSVILNINSIDGLISVFDVFDFEAYRFLTNREPFILFGRSFQLIFVAFILHRVIELIYRRNHFLLTDSVKLFLPILIITSTFVLETSPILRPEAISGNIFILLLTAIIFTDTLTKKDIAVFSALFGFLLAERLIFAFFLPFYLGAVFLLSSQNRFLKSVFAVSMILISFILFCPFIISDTLVVMKSFVGGIIAKMNDKPMDTIFNVDYILLYLKEPVRLVTLALTFLGLFVLLKSRKTVYYILIINLLLFMLLVLRSSLIYDTHVLPAGIITLFLVSFGVSYIVERFGHQGQKLSFAVILVIAFYNINLAFKYQVRVHTRQNLHDAYDWISTLPSETRMLLNPEFEFYLPKAQSCLMREQSLNVDNRKMIRKLNYLLGSKAGMEVEGKNLPIIANAFAFEDERQYEAQYKILLKYTATEKHKVFDYDVYFNSVELASHAVQTELAFSNFHTGSYEYLVTEKQLLDCEPIKVFDKESGNQFYVYKTTQN